MFLGKVIGTVWSTVKWPGLSGIKLLLVRPYSWSALGGTPEKSAPADEGVVCADQLDAGIGDDVIIAYGHAARVALSSDSDAAEPKIPIDAAVVAVVDRFAVE